MLLILLGEISFDRFKYNMKYVYKWYYLKYSYFRGVLHMGNQIGIFDYVTITIFYN